MTLKELTSIKWKTAACAVSAFLAGVFLIELATGALTDPSRIGAFGASSSALVRHGELFRLATANFLYAGVEHFLITTMLLFGLGSLLESRLGGGRFLTILLVSALVGTAGSAFLGHQTLSLGPSTAIAGLGGACAVMAWRWPSKPGDPVRSWIGIALIISIRPWPQAQSFDITGPLIGFLAGAALMLLEARTATLAELKSRRRNLFRGTAALLIALFLVAGGIALRRAGDPGHSPVSHLR